MHGRRGMSPIVATVLLIAFAVALGVVVMKLGGQVTTTELNCAPTDPSAAVFAAKDLCAAEGAFYRVIEVDGRKKTCLKQKFDPAAWVPRCDLSNVG